MVNPSTHKARKRFGQNFLQDSAVIQQIISHIAPAADQHVVEIGPGQGAITRELLAFCNRLDAIELDRDLLPILEKKFSENHFHLHSADALKFDFCSLMDEQKLRIVGNLPYNISTPLIFHILEQHECIDDMHFMLQKEVVDRLAADPGCKAYGKLSVITQAQCEVTSLFEISPEAFHPAPKVTSAFVRLIPRQENLVAADNWKNFQSIVTAAFSHRRKTLRNNLKKTIELAKVEQVIDLSRRAETLSLQEFIQLSELAC